MYRVPVARYCVRVSSTGGSRGLLFFLPLLLSSGFADSSRCWRSDSSFRVTGRGQLDEREVILLHCLVYVKSGGQAFRTQRIYPAHEVITGLIPGIFGI